MRRVLLAVNLDKRGKKRHDEGAEKNVQDAVYLQPSEDPQKQKIPFISNPASNGWIRIVCET
jgi:hypothetical protein